MVVGPVYRVVTEEPEGVVHPPHVPLHVESEAADIGRPSDSGPRRRLLGDGDDSSMVLVDGGVHLLQERNGFEILAAAVNVGSPSTFRA